MILESEVLEGLINFSVDGDSQGLLFSFDPIKFTPSISSDIPKIF